MKINYASIQCHTLYIVYVCAAINTAMHWQESVPPLIHHPQHLDGKCTRLRYVAHSPDHV